jgi:hypothetical protein
MKMVVDSRQIRNHQGRRTAGEVQRLLVIGNLDAARPAGRGQAFLQPQRLHMVGVIIAIDAELTETMTLVERDRRRIVAPDLQPEIDALVLARFLFDRHQQTPGDAGPTAIRIDGEGIKPPQGCSRIEQDQPVAGQPILAILNQTHRISAFEKILKVAPGQPIGFEATTFDLQQGRDIGGGRATDGHAPRLLA